MLKSYHRWLSICLLQIVFLKACCGQETSSPVTSTTIKPIWMLPSSLRLPNTSFPLDYTIQISSNIHIGDFNFTGNLSVNVEIRESTNEIVMHSMNLTIFSMTMRNLQTGEVLDDITYTLDESSSFLIIHPLQNYQAFEIGQQFQIDIAYAGVLCEKATGFYWLTYQAANNATVYIAATQFEATWARRAFPCYDEPSFKSKFTIEITHGANYSAVSNMPAEKLINHTSDNLYLTTTRFAKTPPISTYLVAFILSDFQSISKEYRGITHRIFTQPNAEEKGEKALYNVMRMLAALEDYFGVNYPLPKLDHFALKKVYGAAMENWGLITYKDEYVIEISSADRRKKIKSLMTQSHEIAHQWFGNLVSPEWWTYLWLNEGFATYFSYVITDLLYPSYGVMDMFYFEISQPAYNMGYMSEQPISHYVESIADIQRTFHQYVVTYFRSACIIKMFHHAFQQKTFVKAISAYLEKYQYSAVNEEQLFEVIQDTVVHSYKQKNMQWQHSVSEIMGSWTKSQLLVVVTVVRNYENNTITLRQQCTDDECEYRWWIPINFAYPARPSFEHTVADYFMPPVREVNVHLNELGMDLHKHDWLVANKQHTGFYHVCYDDANFLAIAQQLQRDPNSIHVLNRAAIFQDLEQFIENNSLQYVKLLFELLKYLKYEENVIPWNSAYNNILFLEENLHDTNSYELFKQFIRDLVAPIYKQEISQGQLNENNVNIMEIACVVDLPECLEYARAKTYDYVFHNELYKGKTQFGMPEPILCMGLKYIGDAEFNDILQFLSDSKDNYIPYDNIIYALRCTQSRSHLKQYLNILLGENSTNSIMSNRDSMMYMFYLYKENIQARPVFWEFLKQNYKLLCRVPWFVDNFNHVVQYIPQNHNKEFLEIHKTIKAELEALGSSNHQNDSESDNDEERINLVPADSPRVGQKVRRHEYFLKKYEEDIYEWLKNDQMPMATYAASTQVFRSAAAVPRASILLWSAYIFYKIMNIFFSVSEGS